jgi:hypothetical protein
MAYGDKLDGGGDDLGAGMTGAQNAGTQSAGTQSAETAGTQPTGNYCPPGRTTGPRPRLAGGGWATLAQASRTRPPTTTKTASPDPREPSGGGTRSRHAEQDTRPGGAVRGGLG